MFTIGSYDYEKRNWLYLDIDGVWNKNSAQVCYFQTEKLAKAKIESLVFYKGSPALRAIIEHVKPKFDLHILTYLFNSYGWKFRHIEGSLFVIKSGNKTMQSRNVYNLFLQVQAAENLGK